MYIYALFMYKYVFVYIEGTYRYINSLFLPLLWARCRTDLGQYPGDCNQLACKATSTATAQVATTVVTTGATHVRIRLSGGLSLQKQSHCSLVSSLEDIS